MAMAECLNDLKRKGKLSSAKVKRSKEGTHKSGKAHERAESSTETRKGR